MIRWEWLLESFKVPQTIHGVELKSQKQKRRAPLNEALGVRT